MCKAFDIKAVKSKPIYTEIKSVISFEIPSHQGMPSFNPEPNQEYIERTWNVDVRTTDIQISRDFAVFLHLYTSIGTIKW